MTSQDGKGRAYDALGVRFERVMNRFDLARRLDLVLARVPQGPSRPAVLEVGCGLGYLTERLRSARGLDAVSLDIAGSLLSIGVARGRIAAPVQGSALALPFPDASFDLVVSTECIEHTPEPRAAVHEMLRVLRPAGQLVLTCPNAAWHWAVVVANALGIRPYDGYENWPAWRELRGWVEEAGGEVLEQGGFHAVPFQLPLARRWLPALDAAVLRRFPAVAVNQLIVARRRG